MLPMIARKIVGVGVHSASIDRFPNCTAFHAIEAIDEDVKGEAREEDRHGATLKQGRIIIVDATSALQKTKYCLQ